MLPLFSLACRRAWFVSAALGAHASCLAGRNQAPGPCGRCQGRTHRRTAHTWATCPRCAWRQRRSRSAARARCGAAPPCCGVCDALGTMASGCACCLTLVVPGSPVCMPFIKCRETCNPVQSASALHARTRCPGKGLCSVIIQERLQGHRRCACPVCPGCWPTPTRCRFRT